MSSANIEVSEIQPQLSRAEQEAAVQFAKGHADAAIEILAEVLRAEKVAPLPAWLMLFDLFRVQGRWPDFEDLSKRYTALFGRAAPHWLSDDMLPEGLSAVLRTGGAAHVEIRGSLGPASAPDLARVRVAAERHPVVHIDLTKIAAAPGKRLHAAVEGTAVSRRQWQRCAVQWRRAHRKHAAAGGGCDAQGGCVLATAARAAAAAGKSEEIRKRRAGVCLVRRDRPAGMGTGVDAGSALRDRRRKTRRASLPARTDQMSPAR